MVSDIDMEVSRKALRRVQWESAKAIIRCLHDHPNQWRLRGGSTGLVPSGRELLLDDSMDRTLLVLGINSRFSLHAEVPVRVTWPFYMKWAIWAAVVWWQDGQRINQHRRITRALGDFK